MGWEQHFIHFIHFTHKGKGKARRSKRERGEGWQALLRSNFTRQPDCANARTNETKRFPGWTHPPNLRYVKAFTVLCMVVKNGPQTPSDPKHDNPHRPFWHPPRLFSKLGLELSVIGQRRGVILDNWGFSCWDRRNEWAGGNFGHLAKHLLMILEKIGLGV